MVFEALVNTHIPVATRPIVGAVPGAIVAGLLVVLDAIAWVIDREFWQAALETASTSRRQYRSSPSRIGRPCGDKLGGSVAAAGDPEPKRRGTVFPVRHWQVCNHHSV